MSENDFTYYQSEAAKTAVYRDNCPTYASQLSYVRDGLVSEVGEVCDKFKKFTRDQNGYDIITEIDAQVPLTKQEQLVWAQFRNSVEKELGDVLWYVAMLAEELDLDLQLVMLGNLNKLVSRQKRGQLHGSGDDR